MKCRDAFSGVNPTWSKTKKHVGRRSMRHAGMLPREMVVTAKHRTESGLRTTSISK